MEHWQGISNVVVVGLGMTGLSVVNYLKRFHSDVSVKVIDTRPSPPGLDSVPHSVDVYTGGWNTAWLAESDLVVVNPGIALATPEIQNVLEQGIPVVGDIELFAWHVTKPVIAITGSNGKSTVTDLTGVLASASGLRVGVGGNIGVPALELLNHSYDLYVLELSSFQLETTDSLPLKAAAFLNVSEDHMDRYDSMESYRQAKLRIFKCAETAIVNGDDPATAPDSFSGDLVRFSIEKESDFYLSLIDGEEWLTAHQKPIVKTSDLRLVGKHNVANVLTVLALLDVIHIDLVSILDALKAYRGLTHRCQLVEEKQGVLWINDSKATNVASTEAALSGLTYRGTLYLLVGGIGKGADFSPLAPMLSKHRVELCCFGRDGNQFMGLHPSAHLYETMEEIVENIHTKLVDGDIVMLSPACASMDQFKNFMARGDAFARLAHQYA
ncbi:UDP-N-acetylmuramoyl-L-alanine--D-glutamate ligase [Vibrio salinus]|uniref:UDP-N-acetylmuramoyl-L-alanine--D-glutamate ligase n=1 Tax=Vibrio salinus TaxID=2899784 RepID=UPI001E4AF4E3|nr:UDP-N-acetylmuramoyl-L-alanine--D-glutamate ligase [Vibrio salinus]MCE0494252.1 UDP-N-acetylmuramoyl-L-alanine--D-glutamate ligase [Vibrio salinus]